MSREPYAVRLIRGKDGKIAKREYYRNRTDYLAGRARAKDSGRKRRSRAFSF